MGVCRGVNCGRWGSSVAQRRGEERVSELERERERERARPRSPGVLETGTRVHIETGDNSRTSFTLLLWLQRPPSSSPNHQSPTPLAECYFLARFFLWHFFFFFIILAQSIMQREQQLFGGNCWRCRRTKSIRMQPTQSICNGNS